MRWTPGGNSDDVEDRRSEGGGGGGGFGGMHVGIGGLLVLGVLSLIFRTDLISPFLGGAASSPGASSGPDPQRDAAEKPAAEFVNFVAKDTNDVWEKALGAQGVQYPRAKVVLFRDAIESACGTAQSATGPFYCPGDAKVYIDLAFYDELKNRFGAAGEFAEAYVLAHEMGHHVQDVLGIERKMRALQRQNPGAQNQLSVRMELQADCLAGMWGKTTEQRNILEAGEAEQAITAASAIGDDRLQKQATGHVSPDSFTHGSSAQRVEWFKRGFSAPNIQACDTFEGQLR